MTDPFEIIICHGEQFPCREVEDVLCAHPLVAEAAVLGAPDAQCGQRVVAFVVLREEGKSRSGILAELVAHCRQHLPRFKIPTLVQELKALPKDTTGKIMKQAFRVGAR